MPSGGAWRGWAFPLAAVALIVAAIIAITLYSFTRNRADALGLAQDLMTVLDERVRTEVGAYLASPAGAVGTLAGMVPDTGLSADSRVDLERLALQLLAVQPQLSSLFVGAPNGEFLMVQRSVDGTLDTKQIHIDAGRRTVAWRRRDREGAIAGDETDPDDTYDPRDRAWYRGASASAGPFWTDVYVFFTTRQLGVTVAQAARNRDGKTIAVAGGDIALQALSGFLGNRAIGKNGRAVIIDAAGRLVAFPGTTVAEIAADGRPEPPHLDEVGDALLARVYDRVRVSGDGHSVETIDGQRYIVAASSLAAVTEREWLLIVVVPEEDFVGFVAANSRRTLLMSAGIVALAVGLAALLAWQGLAAERYSRALRRRERAIAAQKVAYSELATGAALVEAEEPAALGRLIERVADALGARRVTIWQLDRARSQLVCVEGFDREVRGHTAGAEIRRSECPELYDALQRGDDIAVDDAAQDARTAHLATLYLGPVGCRSLVVAPSWAGGQVAGSVWIEDGTQINRTGIDALSFARLFGHVIGGHLPAPEAVQPAVMAAVGEPAGHSAAVKMRLAASEAALRTASISDQRGRALLRQLSVRGLDADELLGRLFPDATVLVLRFLDDLALALGEGPERHCAAIGRIVAAFQQHADGLGVRYVKILNDQIVAVEGFDQQPREAALMLADVALALQDECSRSFDRLAGRLDYAIGLDTGAVIGSPVGFGEMAYNVWGDAVRTASLLAATSGGVIQVSEAFYDLLRDRFLFRRRGGFYLPHVGEMTTYVLRGRL